MQNIVNSKTKKCCVCNFFSKARGRPGYRGRGGRIMSYQAYQREFSGNDSRSDDRRISRELCMVVVYISFLFWFFEWFWNIIFGWCCWSWWWYCFWFGGGGLVWMP